MRNTRRLFFWFVGVVVSFFTFRLILFTHDDNDHDISWSPLQDILLKNIRLHMQPRPFDIACLTMRPATQQEHGHPSNVWQRHTEGRIDVYVYSAFHDNRTDVGKNAWVRLLAVANNFEHGYCTLWYPGRNTSFAVGIIVHKSGRGDIYNGTRYDQLQLSCPIPRGYVPPTHVAVSVEPCRHSNIFIPVHVPERNTLDFGICVAIGFGHLNNDQVIEWAELSRRLGVSKIHIYNATIEKQHDALFRYYEQQGFMAVHQMPPPVPLYTKAGAKLASPASLNDCMLRYMYTYRYIILVDFDEVIVPQDDTDYNGLLRAIDAKNPRQANWQSYTFRNVYFFQDFTADDSQPRNFLTLRYRTKILPSPYLFASKSFIDPRRCLSVFNHYCYIRLPNLPSPFTVHVPPSLASSHHYKVCNLGKDCKTLMATNSTDDIMVRYKDYLLQQSALVKTALG